MKYLIIGLGVFGSNLAKDLTDIGAEVIGVDSNTTAIDDVKEFISTTYQIDTTDENALSLLPLKNVDITIVTIGNNFGASIKTVALLKKFKVKRLMVRAVDSLHEAILEGMGVEKILTPEKKAALDLVNELALGTEVSSFAINPTHYIFKFRAPKICIGRSYTDFIHKDFYGLKLIAACRDIEKRNVIGMNSTASMVIDIEDAGFKVENDDILTFYGTLERFRHFYKNLSDD